MADLDQMLEGLTDEQLKELISTAGKKQETKKVKVQLINGEVVEGNSAEELNQILAQKLAAAHQPVEEVEDEPVQTPQNQAPKPPKFDYKKFEKIFVEDPIAGLEYADTVRFGAPMSQLLPQLATALGTSMKKLQELEAQQFIDQNADYEPSVENRKAIEKVMSERGWQTSRQSLEDAYAIAQAKGLIKVKSTKETRKSEPESGPFIPPRSRGASEQTNSELELLARLDGLSDEQVHQLAVKAGIVSK